MDTHILAFAAGQRMKRAMIGLERAMDEANDASCSQALQLALSIAETIQRMPFEVTIWQAQNIWNDLFSRADSLTRPGYWTEGFKRLGGAMNIAVDQLVVEEAATVA